jgi:hypothetical protein
MSMTFDKVPGWAAWLAQDADGTWHPQGAARGCKAAKALKDTDPLRAKARVESYAATATLWGYEAEPNKQDHGWYENEVGRIVRLALSAPPDDWEITLTRRDRVEGEN